MTRTRDEDGMPLKVTREVPAWGLITLVCGVVFQCGVAFAALNQIKDLATEIKALTLQIKANDIVNAAQDARLNAHDMLINDLRSDIREMGR